jgi:hypothetical protein
MAELIYNNNKLKFYCTPKCGISSFKYMIAHGIFGKRFNMGEQTNVIVVRSPWDRVISFYIQKIVISKVTSFNKLDGSNLLDTSFEGFIDILSKVNIDEIDYHLSPQSINVEKVKFDMIINLSNIDEEIKPLLKLINNPNFQIKRLNNTSEKKLKINKGGSIKQKENPNHRRDIVVENAFKLKPKELLEVGIPKDYSYFYNEELIDKVSKIYQKDIDKFNFKCEYK